MRGTVGPPTHCVTMEFTLTACKVWVHKKKVRGKPGKYVFEPSTSSGGGRTIAVLQKNKGEAMEGSPIYLKEATCRGPWRTAPGSFSLEIKYRKPGETKDCKVLMQSKKEEELEKVNEQLSKWKNGEGPFPAAGQGKAMRRKKRGRIDRSVLQDDGNDVELDPFRNEDAKKKRKTVGAPASGEKGAPSSPYRRPSERGEHAAHMYRPGARHLRASMAVGGPSATRRKPAAIGCSINKDRFKRSASTARPTRPLPQSVSPEPRSAKKERIPRTSLTPERHNRSTRSPQRPQPFHRPTGNRAPCRVAQGKTKGVFSGGPLKRSWGGPFQQRQRLQHPGALPLLDDSQPLVHGSGASASAHVPSIGGGILNLGNTCYMNAVMQAIYGIKGFVEDSRRACLVKAAEGGKSRRVLYGGLMSFFDDLDGAVKRKTHADPKNGLRPAVRALFPNFANMLQQDAHEFFVDVINRLHEELLTCKIAVLPFSPSGGLTDLQISGRNDNAVVSKRNFEFLPTTRHFHIELLNTLTCDNPGCAHRRDKLELFRNFSLGLPSIESIPALTVLEALNMYFSKERVEIKCEKCGHSFATKTSSIHALPRVLVLHFKRFEANMKTGKYVKRHDAIDVTETLDLKDFCEPNARNCPKDDLGGLRPPPSAARSPTSAIKQGHSPAERRTPEARTTDCLGKKGLSRAARALVEQAQADERKRLTQHQADHTARGYNTPGPSARGQSQARTPSQASLLNPAEAKTPMSLAPGYLESRAPPTIPADTSTMVEMGRVDFLTPCKSKAEIKTKYSLRGIVHHIGKFAFAGHYVADVLRDEKTWLHCDDLHVSEKSTATLKQSDRRNAYMAFYVLK